MNKKNYKRYKDIDLNSNNINNINTNDDYLNLNEENDNEDTNINNNYYKNENKDTNRNNNYYKNDNEYNIKKKTKNIEIYNNNIERKNDKFSSDNDIISDNKNIVLEREINQLKNENNYKDFIIKDLRNQIEKKNIKEEKKETIIINNIEYNNLIKEIDNKNLYIQKLEDDIKNLKFKIDNLMIENTKIKKENEDLMSQKEELRAHTDLNKIDLLNNLDKVNKLEKMNKKLNKDYLSLSNDFKIIKEEKEKLKSIIEEQNATIYNYEKQLNSRSYNKTSNLNERMINYPSNDKIKNDILNERKSNYPITNDNNNNYNSRDYDINDKYNYSNENEIKSINKYNNEKYQNLSYDKINNEFDYDKMTPLNNTNRIQRNKNLDNIQKEKFNLDYNLGSDFKGRIYNYNNNKNYACNNESMSGYVAEKNKKIKKGELNYLENYLSSLLKERSQLENDLSEIPDHPRTLKDIKLKNSIKDKITQSDREILNIQQQLKKIRGN